MPLDPSAFPFMGPDIAELVVVIITLGISLAIMVALGRWWAQ